MRKLCCLKVGLHITNVLLVDGSSLLSLVLFLRDKEGKGASLTNTTTRTTLNCPTLIQGAVGSSCDCCSLLSLGSGLFLVTLALGRISRPKHGRGFVGGSYSQIMSRIGTNDSIIYKLWSPLCGLHQ